MATTSTSPAEPSIRLLGPVELATAPAAMAPRERALLARLALDAGRTVSLERLVDDLWADRPPAQARNALQVYASHLRGRLGRSSVVSMGGGYRLEVPDDEVDSRVFERLVAVAMGLSSSGRPGEAVGALDDAARLWRGRPLDDLVDYEFARVEASRLTDLRATSLEHLAEALLATGRLERLTDEVGAYLRDFPFRERLRAAVMTGLYKSGRAVEALALYAELVKRLREELGLEPGPSLKALQVAILTDDPSLGTELPTGELTLVATVLDASATLEGVLGDAYGEAVLAQSNTLRSVFATTSGLTVATDGERLLAVFPTAADAVRAAVTAHRALAEHDFPHHQAVRVRIGIHTGTPRVVGQHYGGADVQRVLQVALAASGGQILLTGSTVARLDARSLATDRLHLTDLGTFRLPDATLPEQLHQVAAEPRTTFPPPRSLGGRGNLPRAAVPLVGRDDDLTALVAEVGGPGSAITTLLGPGGAGKTRLAVEVADRIGTTTGCDVYFVPLETARDLADVWTGLASAVGLPPMPHGQKSVLSRLAGRRSLLVLDNLEQLPDVAVVIEQLLGVDADVRVLATSRRPTGVLGERLHPVEPLTDDASGHAASDLFARCAMLVRPGFVLDDDNRDAVARICRRVDGLPLGIELAAARVRQLSPDALATRLESGLDLVTGGATRPDRQRDLGALTAWSYDLLSPHQQRLIELLAIFVGGVDLDTVARLPCDVDPVTAALELADASLVQISRDESPRLTLLETIRDFSLDRLAASGREDWARDLHLAAHVDLARRLHPRRAHLARAAVVVHREGANFEAALDWALANGGDRVESAAEIITCLGTTWHQLGTRAFAYTERTSQALPTHSPFRGWLTYWEYRRRWDLETDEQLLLDLLAVAEDELRHAGDPAPLAALLAYGTNLGPDAGLASDWGVRRAQEAVDLAHSLGDDWLLGTACASLVRALVEADRPRDAIGPLGEARDAFTRRGDVDRLDGLSMLEAELVALDGRHEEAWDIGARAAAGLVATPSDGTLWHTCLSLARLASHDRPAAAATLVGAGLGALSRMGSIPGAADYHHLYDDVGAARAALGEDEFDRLLDAARSWDADTAVAWVLDLIGGTAPA